MLSRKFLSDGDSPGAASAPSGSPSAAATAAAAAHSVTGCFFADARTTTAIPRAGLAAASGEARSDDALPTQRGFPSPRATDKDAATVVAAMELPRCLLSDASVCVREIGVCV
uniref:Uncharacterized protein n=1 Tax=Arundo donax TaxID=35708 RepID=A0A0A9CCZ2_ARUDO